MESNYKMPPVCDPIVQKDTGRKCIFSREFKTSFHVMSLLDNSAGFVVASSRGELS